LYINFPKEKGLSHRDRLGVASVGFGWQPHRLQLVVAFGIFRSPYESGVLGQLVKESTCSFSTIFYKIIIL